MKTILVILALVAGFAFLYLPIALVVLFDALSRRIRQALL